MAEGGDKRALQRGTANGGEPGVWTRLMRLPAAPWALAVLGIVVLTAALGPEFVPVERRGLGGPQFAAPGTAHPLGTDLNGRDLLYRLLIGARISLLVGVAGAVISLFIGTAWGVVAGYFGGKIDTVMMRVVDVLYSVPRLLFLLVLINLLETPFAGGLEKAFANGPLAGLANYSKIVLLILCLGAIEWLTMARIVRGQVLALKEQTFITAARALGQSHVGIVLRHVLPNISGIVLVYLTLTIPTVIIDESFISFLGLGLDASQASWGVLLSDGAKVINPVKSYWWLLVFPAVAMAGTLLAMNLLGDALRDALDPRGKKV